MPRNEMTSPKFAARDDLARELQHGVSRVGEPHHRAGPRAAASRIARADGVSTESGFSQYTALPASSAAKAISAWSAFGAVIATMSTSGSPVRPAPVAVGPREAERVRGPAGRRLVDVRQQAGAPARPEGRTARPRSGTRSRGHFPMKPAPLSPTRAAGLAFPSGIVRSFVVAVLRAAPPGGPGRLLGRNRPGRPCWFAVRRPRRGAPWSIRAPGRARYDAGRHSPPSRPRRSGGRRMTIRHPGKAKGGRDDGNDRAAERTRERDRGAGFTERLRGGSGDRRGERGRLLRRALRPGGGGPDLGPRLGVCAQRHHLRRGARLEGQLLPARRPPGPLRALLPAHAPRPGP